jgi:hypothetical protein
MVMGANKSFSLTWTKAHEPNFEKKKRERTKIVLEGAFVA